jgi:hypothetical protein
MFQSSVSKCFLQKVQQHTSCMRPCTILLQPGLISINIVTYDDRNIVILQSIIVNLRSVSSINTLPNMLIVESVHHPITHGCVDFVMLGNDHSVCLRKHLNANGLYRRTIFSLKWVLCSEESLITPFKTLKCVCLYKLKVEITVFCQRM